MNFGVSAYFPSASHALLIKTALHPSDATARAAWSAWEDAFDIEAAGWSEMRLFPAVVARLQRLGMETPFLPRMLGVKRYIWSKRQKQLATVRPHLAALLEAGIVPLVTKGTARIALDPRAAAERYSADIDLVIAPADWERAVDILLARGLETPWPRDRIVHRMREWRHAVEFREDELEIDLHQSALFLNRCLGDDDAMRERASAGSLLGLSVLVPSPTDRLIMAMVHGLHYDPTPPADWVLDAVSAMRDADLDWAVFEDETRARRVSAFAMVGLAFLAEELDQDVPGALRERLAAEVGEHFLEDFDSNFRGYGPTSAHDAAARYLASVERARAAAARRPATDTPPLPPGDWLPPVGVGRRDGATLSVPRGINPQREMRLDIRLPASRYRFRRRVHVELRCNFEIRTIVRQWIEPSTRRLPERVVSIRIAGAYLALREIKELQLRAWSDGPFGNRHWLPLDRLGYRWSEIA